MSVCVREQEREKDRMCVCVSVCGRERECVLKWGSKREGKRATQTGRTRRSKRLDAPQRVDAPRSVHISGAASVPQAFSAALSPVSYSGLEEHDDDEEAFNAQYT